MMNSLVSIDFKSNTLRRYERSDNGKSFILTHRCEAIAGPYSIDPLDIMGFRRNPNEEFALPRKTYRLGGAA